MLVSGYISIWTTNQIEDLTNDVLHTNEVIRLSNTAYTEFLESESNIRAYILTDNKQFASVYEYSMAQLPQYLDSLQQMTRNVTQQQLNVKLLRNKIEERIIMFDSAFVYFNMHHSLAGFINPIMVDDAASDARLLRDYVNRIVDFEQQKYQTRNNKLLNSLASLPFIVIVLSLVGLATAVMSFFSFRQYNIAQKLAEAKEKAYRAQLEDQVKQLNFSNKELEQFAYVASHDLQEPLRKITSFIDLLNEQYADKIDGEGKLYMERIAFSSRRMRNLINDLLSFSRAGRRLEQKEEVDLNDVMEIVLADLELSIRENKADISVPPLPKVVGSETEFVQVFENLLSNALKFSKEGVPPEIVFDVKPSSPEDVKEVPEYDKMVIYHTITIQDNGIGFEPEYSSKIFNLFQRLHGRTAYSGTGIGLAICKRIVEKYGGGMYATSVPGEGSAFHLILPIQGPN